MKLIIENMCSNGTTVINNGKGAVQNYLNKDCINGNPI